MMRVKSVRPTAASQLCPDIESLAGMKQLQLAVTICLPPPLLIAPPPRRRPPSPPPPGNKYLKILLIFSTLALPTSEECRGAVG